MRPGTHSTERITLARLPSGVKIDAIKHTYQGVDEGPTVYIQAAQHGREINGTEVLRRVHERIPLGELCGRVVTIPIADPITFDLGAYTTPEAIDHVNENMNRLWPGDAEGTIHERMAARLWKYASNADVIVDLHTSKPDTLTHVVFTESNQASRNLADAFGTDLLVAEAAYEQASEEWHSRRFESKLRVAAANHDIPSITPELAYRRQISETAVETGVTGVLNVLRHQGLLESAVVENGIPIVAENHLRNVKAAESGFFVPRPDRRLGASVEAEEILGTLYDPQTYQTLQTVAPEWGGVLYGLSQEPRSIAGETLAQIAIPIDD